MRRSVHRGRTVAVCVLAFALAPALARSDPDYRLGDRFFFGVYGGVAASNAGRVTETYMPYLQELTAGGADLSATRPAFGYSTSFWPDDYLGVGVDVQAFTLVPPAPRFSTTNVSFGVPLRIAVPLRYIQPYAGVWGGWSTTWVKLSLPDTEITPLGSGAHLHYHLLAGSNVYVSRNLRFFVEYQYWPLSFSSSSGDPTSKSGDGVTYASTHADVVVAGAIWSPDFYHAARTTESLDIVWGSVAGSVVLWGLLNLIGRG